jgi:hypothetical protein
MAITFYYGSGSPFAWKGWLVLEDKQTSYGKWGKWGHSTFPMRTRLSFGAAPVAPA